MSDIIERAEALNIENSYANRELKASLVPELVAELKATLEAKDELRELLEKWYRIAANEAVAEHTQHGYRECANQLDDVLGAWSAKPTAVDR